MYRVAGRVSGYAQKNPTEFVAEVFAGVTRNGEKYDDEICMMREPRYKQYSAAVIICKPSDGLYGKLMGCLIIYLFQLSWN